MVVSQEEMKNLPVGALGHQLESTRNPRLKVRKEMVTTTEVDNLLIDSGK